MDSPNPLIVQSDNTLLLEVDNPLFEQARDAVGPFAHLEKSPEHIHTYLITALSLWNAASLGIAPDEVIDRLKRFSRYEVPANVTRDVREIMGRYGRYVLTGDDGNLLLYSEDAQRLQRLVMHPRISPLVGPAVDDNTISVPPGNRGVLKQAFITEGYPIEDRAGYVDGAPLEITVRPRTRDGSPFSIRSYQKQAAESFLGGSDTPGGSGVVVLPCGAGKTIVGICAMALLKRRTLVLVTNIVAARQWKEELLDKTDLSEEDIGEYSGESKVVKPVTLATYQILTYRKKKKEQLVHFGVFNSENWGLIIYDEVHLLPAPVFKLTAEIQARRRLGLTATLVREDGHEHDVFSLIGPKKYDVPWKELERQGWIATARCIEIRIDLPPADKFTYLSLSPHRQIRLAYENRNKLPVVDRLVREHADDRVLIMGQYLSQLQEYANALNCPLITGATRNAERTRLYREFREGRITRLVLSRVGNFAVDLPDANVAIQISGTFGSRQEEAQRLGRILRPKRSGEQAVFYSIVTRETRELEFAMKRQLFLTEQGYSYEIDYETPE